MDQKTTETFQQTCEEMQKVFSGSSKTYEQLSGQCKKNMETLGEATRVMTETMQKISHMNMEYMQKSFEDLQGVLKESTSSPHQSQAKISKCLKENLSQIKDHGAELTKIMGKSTDRITSMMHECMEGSLKSMKV